MATTDMSGFSQSEMIEHLAAALTRRDSSRYASGGEKADWMDNVVDQASYHLMDKSDWQSANRNQRIISIRTWLRDALYSARDAGKRQRAIDDAVAALIPESDE